MTLDKLPGIRGDLMRTDPEWEKWDFAKLNEAVRLWTRRNPIDTKSHERDLGERRNQKWDRSRKLYQARGQDFKRRECVYCGDVSHKPSNSQKITKIEERRATLAQKNLCFNCIAPNHRAAECFSKATCQHCKKRHHTSICDVATEEEAKVIREVLKTSQTKESADVMDQLLEMHDLRRALRVNTWVARFIHNCRGRQKLSGPLSKSEIDN
ncbi:hypothetical protein P5673_020284, partial [Acropora cervicornis]